MTCSACQAAAADRRSGLLRAGCQGCAARDIARGPAFFYRNDDELKAREYRGVLAAARLSPAAVMRAHEADKARAAT